jgi:metal-responsive CopG/Arc/MetJ family transcriptional regulator
MRISISVPDPTFRAAERVAKRLGMSRSRLYATAVEEFVKVRRDVDARQTRAKVYRGQQATVDPVLDELQAEALREEW